MTRTPRVPVQARGRRRRAAIIEAAETLLLEHGYAALSMRRVAADAGISLGNLQHYFSDRRELLQALLAKIEEELRGRFEAKLGESLTAEERLSAGVELLLDHVATPSGSLPLWDLWALAGHDDQARDLMDAGYTRLRRDLGVLIADVNPRLSSEERANAAAAIVALIEGSSLLIGYGKPAHGDLQGLSSYLSELVLTMVHEGPNR